MSRFWRSVLCLIVVGTLATVLITKEGSNDKLFLRTTPLPSISVDENNRRMSILDPRSTLPKVPKILHLTIADNPPVHQMKVIEYSIRTAESHGFKVMLHRDSDADALIRKNYPELIQSWEKLVNNEKIDRGARIGDFVRIVLLHHYGGVYIDGDVVPCWDLTELVNEPGVATFPLLYPKNGQIVNCVMSGPPGHLVWEIALDMMKNNERLDTQHILGATGPGLVAAAADAYFDATKTPPIVRLMKGEYIPKPEDGGIWQRSGLMRYGAVGRGRRSSVGLGTLKELGLVHLHWRSWMGENHPSKQTRCNTELDLIDGFLDFACKTVSKIDSRKWSECGEVEFEK